MKLKLLDKVEEQWKGCERCTLSKSRARIVHWRGSPEAPLFLIGEAPGADEDAAGRPFVGRAGRMLDLLLREAGLSNEDVFMTNTVACRPPGRWPEDDEMKACRPRLQTLLRIVRPGALLLMGSKALALAGLQSVRLERGKPTSVDMMCYDGKIRSWPAVPTWSAAFVARAGGQGSPQFLQAQSDIVEAWKLANSVDRRPIR